MKKRIAVTGLLLVILMPLAATFAFAMEMPDFDYYQPNAEEREGAFPYGGSIRMADRWDAELNPLTSIYNNDVRDLNIVYDRLVILDQEWRLIPWFARSWEVSDDELSITFNLVQTATWHDDGTPVTAEDVKWTFDYNMEHNSPLFMNPDGQSIDYITAPDDHTLVIHLKHSIGTNFFQSFLSTIHIIKPEEWEKIDNPLTHSIGIGTGMTGSGPFIFTKWVKGQYVEMTANDDWWGGRPYVDTVYDIYIPDTSMGLMALQKGEVEMAFIRPENVATVLGFDNARINKVERPGYGHVGFNMRRAPFNDVNLRKALSYAIDRERITNTIYMGYAFSNYRYLPPQYGDFVNPDVPIYEYDLVKAASILDQAGYIDQDGDGWRDMPNGDPLTIDMLCQDQSDWIRNAEIITGNWIEIGVNAKFSPAMGPALWDRLFVSHDYDCCIFNDSCSSPWVGLLLGTWTTMEAQAGGDNFPGFTNARYDELYSEATVESDPDVLREIVYEMQMMLSEACPVALVVRPHSLVTVTTDVYEGWVNAVPFGPISHLDEIGFLEVHMKGGAAAKESLLSITCPATGEKEDTIQLTATLTTADGEPIEGVYVEFYEGGLGIGAVLTAQDGTATLHETLIASGDHAFKAEFGGSPEYTSAASDTEITEVAEPDEPDEPDEPIKPDYSMLYIIAIVALVAVIAYLYTRKN